jgi:hypothetical protein
VRHQLLATGRFVTTLPEVALRFNAEFFSLKVLPVKLASMPRPLMKRFIECAQAVAKERNGLRQ